MSIPLGELSPARFLRDYWQKKPLLIRNAIPEFADPLTPQELAGLACEAEIASRLVLERGGDHPWQVRYGPFEEEDFITLPDDYWTLLVQDVEKHVPELHFIVDWFHFIPDWRVDDLMISYAAPYGSVGPHWDEYDVFLLQGLGQRHWQINTGPVTGSNHRVDTELRILQRFSAEQEWTLQSGDMLYLPPKVAHYGKALEPSMTYSIGFRAPSHREMIEHFIDFTNNLNPSSERYADPDLLLQNNPGKISQTTLDKIGDTLLRHLQHLQETGTDLIPQWFGRFITESAHSNSVDLPPALLDLAELQQRLVAGSVLKRNPYSRFAYIEQECDGCLLFIDGKEFKLKSNDAWLAPLLCRQHTFQQSDLTALFQYSTNNLQQLLLELVNSGYLVIYENG